MEVTFRGSPAHTHARFDVNIMPVEAAPQQLPVSATIRGAYAIDTLALELTQLSATARSLKLETSGTMARNYSLRLALTVGNLRDLDSLLATLSPSHRLPDGVTGRGTFTGNLTGTPAATQLAGEVALGDFTLPIPLTAAARQRASTPMRLARFDSFTAQVQYSPSQLTLNNARLRRGPEDAAFTLSLGLDQGAARGTLPLRLRADIHSFEIHDLQAILGFDYAISGLTTATLEVSGTADDPLGSGHLRIAKAMVDGEPYQDFSADVVFANQEAQLANVLIVHNGARVTGTAAYNLKTAAFRFNLKGSGFNLAQFTQLQLPRISVGGTLNFDARACRCWLITWTSWK